MLVPTTQGHVAADDLERFSLGLSSERISCRIEEHILICHSCQARLESAEKSVAAMREALERASLHGLVA